MAIASSTRYKKYSPVTSTSEFLVTFPIFDTDDLTVYVDGAPTTAYSVTATFSDGVSTDASITLTTAVSGVDVEIFGDRAPARADYSTNSPDIVTKLQFDLDRLTAEVQEMKREAGRSLVLPMGESITRDLPAAATRASRMIGFDGTGLIATMIAALPDDVTVTSFMETVLATTDTETAFAALIASGVVDARAQLYPGMYALGNIVYLTNTGTYTPPSGVRALRVICLGGGGAGGGTSLATSGGEGGAGAGGSAGGRAQSFITSVAASYAYAVGAGGTVAAGADGGNGGNTTFGSITANGGVGGLGGAGGTNVVKAGRAGGSGSSADIVFQGEAGREGIVVDGKVTSFGHGASSPFGSGGRVSSTNSGGEAGAGYGSGGSGGTLQASGSFTGSNSGGAGAAGIIIVEELY